MSRNIMLQRIYGTACRIVLVLVMFFSAAPVVQGGFGITPPYVRNDKLTQGSTFTQEIILVRGDPVEDLKAELTINVPGIEDWIVIDRGTEFLLPRGEKQVVMKVTVRVPQNASYERHQGNIRIRTMSPDPASGVSIALGAQIDFDIRVVDEIRDFDVKRVQISETEEPRRRLWLEFPGKITFSMGIQNTGNAPTAPSRVELSVYDRRGNVVLEQAVNTNVIESVLPFETRDVVAYLPTKLPPGAYLVRYQIFRFEDEVKRSGELTLSVLPRGTLAGYMGYGIDGLSFGDRMSVVVPAALLFAAILIVAAVVYLRRSRPKRKRSRRSDAHDEPPQVQERQTRPLTPSSGSVVDLSRRRIR